MKRRFHRILSTLIAIYHTVGIVFNPLTEKKVAAETTTGETSTALATQLTTIKGTDRQGNPISLQVLMPDWSQTSFSNMPGVLTDGGFTDTSLNEAAGYDISRQWQAGQTPDQYLKLGDISEALKAELFSLNQIANITNLDLDQVALSAFPLLGKQTLKHLVDIVPELRKWSLKDVPPIAELVGKDVDISWQSMTIGELLHLVPKLGKLKLDKIDLDKYSLNSIPNLDRVALEKFTNWENSFLKEIPGLGQAPLALFPNPIGVVGNVVARIDTVYSKAEAERHNTISGSNVDGFNVPCRENCAYIELDDLENEGHSYRSSFEGKQWISGKYQKVSGGSGVCGKLNGGKEPTGRLPFGKAFKVVVWDVDETTDTVNTALFFRISCGWLGKSPYMIGPVPWFSYKVNAPIFVGAIKNATSSSKLEPSTPQTSSPTLSHTVQITENAARLKNATTKLVAGAQVAGVSVDALAEATAQVGSNEQVESSSNDRTVGAYVCANGNCGRALGKYQFMSSEPDVQAVIAAKPGGKEFLEQLQQGKTVTEDQVFEFFPPEDQERLFSARIENQLKQTSQEIDPSTGQPYTGKSLIERVAQKHFGGDASQVDSTATDALGEQTLYEYGKKVLESYLQRADITVAQSPPSAGGVTSGGVKADGDVWFDWRTAAQTSGTTSESPRLWRKFPAQASSSRCHGSLMGRCSRARRSGW